MASLTRLPQELSLQVFSYLSLRDKVRLSAANKDYRALFAPEIFATVTFTNDDRVAQSALAAVKVYGKYTTRIEFGPELIAQISDEDRISPEDKLTSPVLLPAAAELLQGRHTPNLQAAQIHFDFEFDVDAWDDDGEGFSIYTFEEPEDEGRTRDKEEYWEWRALMKETWQALSSNPHVKDLTIKEFVPRWTSAFRTDDFRSFLGRLESANLSILGMDNGAGWKTNTVECYVIFLAEDLDQVFFHHMHNLRYLAIHASEEGPLGCEGLRHIPLALKPDDLPALHSLILSNCFVGPELVDFIRSHAQTLTSLDIGGCLFYIAEFAYVIESTLTKISILLLYLRIFPDRKFREHVFMLMVAMALFCAAFVVTLLTYCVPFDYTWMRWNNERHGKCINMDAQTYTCAALNIVLDIVIFFMPIPQLMKLDLSWKKKMGIIFTFLVGLFVTICSVVRLHALIDWTLSTNPTMDYAKLAVWSLVELDVGVICACMPGMAGLFRHLKTRGTEYVRSRGSQNASQMLGSSSRPGFACNGITKTTVVSVQCTQGGSDDDSESEVELVQRSKENYEFQKGYGNAI
ncbi:hypothetical protein PG989_016410 [Apiospora arundinis]